MNRINKAIGYLKARKSYNRFKEDKNTILRDIDRLNNEGGSSVHGVTYGIVGVINGRFKNAFNMIEFKKIIQGL